MPASPLTGSRIRNRRQVLGLKQAALAETVGISPSYLNLIEHNRRRIGGKLLGDLAAALGVDMSSLSEGAETALVMGLRTAATAAADQTGRGPQPEADRIEEFCGRFPGWAGALDAGYRRIERLERTVATLTDRLTHDPYLSASLHEVLSRVTAIRSTAAILTETEEIDATWQRRFQANLHDDAQSLSESAQGLVSYLDGAGDADRGLTSPQEELDSYLARRGYHIAALEQGGDVAALAAEAQFSSAASRDLAVRYLAQYGADAQALPLVAFQAAAEAAAYDVMAIAAEFDVSAAQVMRRLATLPEGTEIGRVACDGAGALLFRKPLPGFLVPRFGAACALWPLYTALRNPGTPIRAVIAQGGREPRALTAIALAEVQHIGSLDNPVLSWAEMILLPDTMVQQSSVAQEIGATCRICAKTDCAARREASILSDVG